MGPSPRGVAGRSEGLRGRWLTARKHGSNGVAGARNRLKLCEIGATPGRIVLEVIGKAKRALKNSNILYIGL